MCLCSFFLTTACPPLSAISSSYSSTFHTRTASALTSRVLHVKTSHHFMIRHAERCIVRPRPPLSQHGCVFYVEMHTCVSVLCNMYNEVNTNSWPLPSALDLWPPWNSLCSLHISSLFLTEHEPVKTYGKTLRFRQEC